MRSRYIIKWRGRADAGSVMTIGFRVMIMRIGAIARVGLLLMLAACGGDLSAPTGPISVHGVVITVTVPGRCIVGGCDPPGLSNTLGLVQAVNTGPTVAYLRACGNRPAFVEGQSVKGEWTLVGPADACPFTPGPIALAPGDSVQENWWFAAGRRRITLAVAGSANLSDEALDASASFDVR